MLQGYIQVIVNIKIDDAYKDIAYDVEKIKFEDFKKCLQNNEIILRSQQTFEIEAHNVFTEKVNRIVLILMMIKVCNHFTE